MMGYESFLGGPPYGGVNMDFNNSTPIINYVGRPMNFGDITATICDTSGNALFYTNAVYIAAANLIPIGFYVRRRVKKTGSLC